MDPKEFLTIINDGKVQVALHSIFERTTLEQASFVAVVFSSIVSTIALLIVFRQLKAQISDSTLNNKNIQAQITILTKQISDDHLRSRREIALEMLKTWTITLRHESQRTRKFVETLTDVQSLALANYQSVPIDKAAVNQLLACLQHSFPHVTESQCVENGFIVDMYATHLRFVALSYLNLLETILTAWYHSIGDQEILKLQFTYLFNPKGGSYALERFRTALGGENFPSINAFVAELREDHRRSSQAAQPGTGI